MSEAFGFPAELSRTLEHTRALLVVRGLGLEKTRALATTAWAAGLGIVEVTVQRPEDLEALRVVRESAPDGAVVGAGTIVSREGALAARAAGAQFGVSPGYDPSLVAECAALDWPLIPGVATPSEIQAALRQGLTWLKAFPAASLGPSWFRQVRAPFPEARLIATGGVTAASAPVLIRAGASIVGLGASFSAANVDEFRALARALDEL